MVSGRIPYPTLLRGVNVETVEQTILKRVFEQLDAKDALTPEIREALWELLRAPGALNPDKLVAVLTVRDVGPSS